MYQDNTMIRALSSVIWQVDGHYSLLVACLCPLSIFILRGNAIARCNAPQDTATWSSCYIVSCAFEAFLSASDRKNTRPSIGIWQPAFSMLGTRTRITSFCLLSFSPASRFQRGTIGKHATFHALVLIIPVADKMNKRLTAATEQYTPALCNILPGMAQSTANIFPGLSQGIQHAQSSSSLILLRSFRGLSSWTLVSPRILRA